MKSIILLLSILYGYSGYSQEPSCDFNDLLSCSANVVTCNQELNACRESVASLDPTSLSSELSTCRDELVKKTEYIRSLKARVERAGEYIRSLKARVGRAGEYIRSLKERLTNAGVRIDNLQERNNDDTGADTPDPTRTSDFDECPEGQYLNERVGMCFPRATRARR